ncbi:MAG: hypothetical protein HFH39_01270 [Lachnospiraceae bacterium]|jgi:hypothetical protein|nr:hypothetical protein [Lachnospiraceae bacterium]
MKNVQVYSCGREEYASQYSIADAVPYFGGQSGCLFWQNNEEKQNKWLLFLYVFSIIQSERCVSFMWIALFKGIDFKEPVYCTVKNVWIWREKKDGVKYCVT